MEKKKVSIKIAPEVLAKIKQLRHPGQSVSGYIEELIASMPKSEGQK